MPLKTKKTNQMESYNYGKNKGQQKGQSQQNKKQKQKTIGY